MRTTRESDRASGSETLTYSGTGAHYRQCRSRQPMLDEIKGDVCESANDLCEEYEDGELREPELTAAVPGAVEALRADPFVADRVAPLRPARRRRRA